MPNIYLIQSSAGSEKLLEMTEQPSDSEDLLQTLLAQHPDILAGDQMPGDDPLRWLLVRREAAVPGADGGPNRWALDHLFLDQHGIPTLVEVKRASDTRIRREVLGQMLDYAANAIVYWPTGHIQETFKDTCRIDAGDVDWRARLIAHLNLDSGDSPDDDPDTAIDKFWDAVDTNLRAGKVRLVFVADAIPRELRRIVEFLNEQMNPAEVLAVEIKQYVGGEVRTLVPKVYGETGTSTHSGRNWDRESFLSHFQERFDEVTANTIGRILDWADQRLPASNWGHGKSEGSFRASFVHSGTRFSPFGLWSRSSIQIKLGHLSYHPPLDREDLRREFAERLNMIGGVEIPSDRLASANFIHPSLLNPETELQKFFAAVEWLIAEVRKT